MVGWFLLIIKRYTRVFTLRLLTGISIVSRRQFLTDIFERYTLFWRNLELFEFSFSLLWNRHSHEAQESSNVPFMFAVHLYPVFYIFPHKVMLLMSYQSCKKISNHIKMTRNTHGSKITATPIIKIQYLNHTKCKNSSYQHWDWRKVAVHFAWVIWSCNISIDGPRPVINIYSYRCVFHKFNCCHGFLAIIYIGTVRIYSSLIL